ncbi:MAG: hypothetical protein M1827_005466 [Pycnora praestabilis]|nr:MAG: hypothetical protein M1827_005466 [Pycnora praestabilis]
MTSHLAVNGEHWIPIGKNQERIDMTRSHKINDRDHVGLADGSAAPEEHLPRYFAKTGHVDADPKKTKKDGGGKGNWGRSGDEVQDYSFQLNNPRRRSNSSSHGHTMKDFKTKFETVDPEPVFEEEIHGAHIDDDGLKLEKEDSADSTSGGSIDEEELAKKIDE